MSQPHWHIQILAERKGTDRVCTDDLEGVLAFASGAEGVFQVHAQIHHLPLGNPHCRPCRRVERQAD